MKLKLLGLSLIATVLLTGCGEVAQGSKVGQVVKVNESSGSLHFTIKNNPKAVEAVKQAMLERN